MAVTADLSGVTVLVTGASGFIGSRMVVHLDRLGAAVHGISRRAPDGIPGRWITADLRDHDALRRAVTAVGPDVTFSLAAYGVDPAERDEALAGAINADAVAALADAVGRLPEGRWRGMRFVHAGSALEYGTAAGNLDETTEAAPTTSYGRSKLAGTMRVGAARERGLRACTARLFTVYGPGERTGRLLPTLLDASRSTGTIALSAGRQRRDFTYVDDVVEGMVRLALASAAPPVVNLATGVLTPVHDFVTRAASALAIDPARLAFGSLPTRLEEMQHDPVSIARLERATGWRPRTSIEEGVARTAREAA